MAKAKLGTGRVLPTMLVVRTGWMTYYAGSIPGDEQPVRGGAYNNEKMGHELFNFLDLNGILHGYAEPAPRSKSFNLRRIDPSAKGDYVENVLVAFIATHRNGGQYMVGWYRHARVYRVFQQETDMRRSSEGIHFWFHFEAAATEAVLLPLNARELAIPHGGGAMGEANVFYLYDGSGKERNFLWLEQIVDFIETYNGENLLQTTKGGPEEAAVKGAESAEMTDRGQGLLRDAAIRQQVELRAMTVAERYFEGQGWHMADHSANMPYDFRGVKDGEELLIEVKGTQGDGRSIFLTPREVECARKHHPQTALVVVTGIQVSTNEDRIEAHGGELHIIQPWYPADASLKPLAYQFQTGLGVNS